MILHDIVKGMGNASQAIDENFKNGSIVNSVEGEDSFTCEFGNGLVIEAGIAEYDRTQSELRVIPTTLFTKVFSVELTTRSMQFADVQDSACLGVGTYPSGEFRVMKHTGLPFRVSTGNIPLHYIIIGTV